MIYQVTDGSYSDFGLVATLDGPDGVMPAQVDAWRAEFEAAAKFVCADPPRPDGPTIYEWGNAKIDPKWRIYWDAIHANGDAEQRYHKAIGVRDGGVCGFVDWLVSRHGFRVLPVRTIHEMKAEWDA